MFWKPGHMKHAGFSETSWLVKRISRSLIRSWKMFYILHFAFKIYLLQTYNALDRSHFGCLSTKLDQDHGCCHLLIPINSVPRFYVSNEAFCEGISMSFLWRVCVRVSLSLYHFILHVSFNEKISHLEKEISFVRTLCIYQTILLSCTSC